MTIPSFLLHVCLYTTVAVWIIVCKFFAHKKTFEYKITLCQWVQTFLPWQIWGFLLGIIMSHVYRQQIKLRLNCTIYWSQITACLQPCDFSLSQYWEFLILCGNNFTIYQQIWDEHLLIWSLYSIIYQNLRFWSILSFKWNDSAYILEPKVAWTLMVLGHIWDIMSPISMPLSVPKCKFCHFLLKLRICGLRDISIFPHLFLKIGQCFCICDFRDNVAKNQQQMEVCV